MKLTKHASIFGKYGDFCFARRHGLVVECFDFGCHAPHFLVDAELSEASNHVPGALFYAVPKSVMKIRETSSSGLFAMRKRCARFQW